MLVLALSSLIAATVFASSATARVAAATVTAPQNGASVILLAGAGGNPPPLDAALVARGATVYAEHCARCHGEKLEGQANWRRANAQGRYPAPPHTDAGHAWQHGDPVLLADIMDGLPLPNTDMQGFRGKLSSNDQAAALAFIKSTWSPETREYQWRMTLTHHLWGGTGH